MSEPASADLAGWRPLRSVRARILVTMLLVAAAGMLVAGGTAYLVQRERTLAAVDERLATVVDDIQFVATDVQAATLDEALTAMVQRVRPGTGESAFALVDGTTALVPGGTIDFHLENEASFVTRVVAETGNTEIVRGSAQLRDRLVRYVAIPVRFGAAADPGIFVLGVDLDAQLSPITEAFRTYTVVALLALVVVGLVGWFVAGRLLRPIRSLRETAARITASDLSERIEVTGSDDVSELTGTVNGMLDRLQAAMTGQRQLLDDVGHELKTPITIVRGHLELMSPSEPEDVAETRALAIDELDRMNGLVRDISDLAQLQRPLQLRIETTDIAALTERVRTKASALSTEHRWIAPERAAVTAEVDPERLTQALLQFAANAVTHGGAARTIEIGSAVRGDRLVLWVRDDGEGIDPAIQSSIFERFRRGAVGRKSGSGLGLAIVSAIAVAHGGVAKVESAPGAGATFLIELPLVRRTEGTTE